MNRYQSLVQDFHLEMGLPVGDLNAPKTDNSALRMSLVDEEMRETIEAFGAKNLVGVIDGLGDTAYVGAGTAVQYGLVLDFPDRPKVAPTIALRYPTMFMSEFKHLKKEVLAALSCSTCGLAKVKFYLERLCFDCIEAASDLGVDLWPFFQEIHRSNLSKVGATRRADGKIQKPPGYTPPNIRGMLIEQGWRP